MEKARRAGGLSGFGRTCRQVLSNRVYCGSAKEQNVQRPASTEENAILEQVKVRACGVGSDGGLRLSLWR